MSVPAEILAHPAIWRGNRPVAVSSPSLSTGFPVLDAELPGGGWPTAALIEILPQHEGIGELRILGHALSRLTAQGRFLVWIAPPYLPYAPALRSAGIDLARLILVRTRSPRETLWASEQALRSNACAAVLAWPQTANYAELRRLQIAAEGSPVLAVLFRPPRVAREATPAPLRLSLATAHGELAVRVLKRRGSPLVNPILLRSPLPHTPCMLQEQVKNGVARAVVVKVRNALHSPLAPQGGEGSVERNRSITRFRNTQ